MSGLLLGILASSLASGGDFESIATVTVGSGGASSIEFTSIPGTYQHLQIRASVRSTTTNLEPLYLRLNGDSSTSSYTAHQIYGDGLNPYGQGWATGSWPGAITAILSTATSVYGAAVIDVLDAFNTTKYRTVRTFFGTDANGSGQVGIRTALWLSTATLSSLTFTCSGMAQYSTVALYGIKAP